MYGKDLRMCRRLNNQNGSLTGRCSHLGCIAAGSIFPSNCRDRTYQAYSRPL